MKYLSYKERLREQGLLILVKRRAQDDLIAAFWYLKGSYRKRTHSLAGSMVIEQGEVVSSIKRVDLGLI